MPRSHLITPWRRLFQWTLAMLWFGVPFVRIEGRGLIEIDLPAQTLHLSGTTFRIEELLLFWLVVMVAIFLFLLLTMVLGRVWCGWACPQTAFVDLVEAAARRLGLQVRKNRITGRAGPRFLLGIFFLASALLAGASFVWYFLPPGEYFRRLFHGELGIWPLGTTLVLAGLVFLDLFFLRRLFCRDFCPYGRFQTIIIHPGTLTLRELPGEADRCLDCRACVRACPMGIDIRDGYQIECINCASCLDACRKVMALRGEAGIIGYTFGSGERGWRTLVDLRLTAIAVIVLGLLTGLVLSAGHLSPVSLKLQRAAGIRSQPGADGQVATVFTGYLRNRSDQALHLTITAALADGAPVEITGPGELAVAGNENRRVQLGVLTPAPAGKPLTVIFTVSDRQGRKILASRGNIPQSAE